MVYFCESARTGLVRGSKLSITVGCTIAAKQIIIQALDILLFEVIFTHNLAVK